MTVHKTRVIVLAAVLVCISALVPSSALVAESTAVVEQQSVATVVFNKNSGAIVTILTPSGIGSGVLVDPSGVIVTNLHVIEGDASATVTLASGDIYDDVQVIAVDERRDIVIIKIAGFQLPTVEFGDSDDVEVGEGVYAIGAPRGLALTISEGIISGIRRSPGDDGSQVLQTTAAISPGSSGGGLFDEDGRLIGITTSRILSGESLNFAVPINYVRGIVATAPKWTLAEFNMARAVPAPARRIPRVDGPGDAYPRDIERENLTGIRVVNVVVEELAEDAEAAGLTRRSLLAAVERRLEARRVPLGNSRQGADLYINVATHESRRGLYVYYARVSVQQLTTIEGNQLRARADTWANASLGMVGEANLLQVEQVVIQLVDLFLDDYFEVNDPQAR